MSYRTAISLLLGGALAACTNPTPQWDTQFGESVRTAVRQQTLNPDAGKRGQSIDGMDGISARESIERYHDSFKAPPPTFEIILGTGQSR